MAAPRARLLKDRIHLPLLALRPSIKRKNITSPLKLLGKLEKEHWKNFVLGYLAWVWDAFDFHSVTLSYPDLMKQFDRSLTQLSLAVTLTLMTRPIGGAIFGLLSDRYGRRWPFVANCLLLIIFVLYTAFYQTYEQFVAARALFGCAMGGIYGNAAATALEDCPEESRGLMSGWFQSGYPMGYVLAVVFYKAFHNTPHHWRSLFWFGSAMPVLLIGYRIYYCSKETRAWRRRKEMIGSQHTPILETWADILSAINRHWALILYLVFLLMGMMYLSHATQDIYPYHLRYRYRHLGSDDAVISKTTTIQTVASLGGVVGGMTTGYGSQILGRRLAIIVVCVIGGLLLYPYTFTMGNGIHAAAFFEQFCVQGAWSVIPIHLLELAPAAFRTFVVGTSYQMASLLASGSNTILVRIATRYPGEPDQDSRMPEGDDFSIPIAVFAACTFVYVIIFAALGPERRGRDMIRNDEWVDPHPFPVPDSPRPRRAVHQMPQPI